MEDENLLSLFTKFKPELSSDFQFMTQLQERLNSVELIKQHAAEERKRNKKAIAIAVLMGFIVGFIFSLSLPYLGEAVSKWQSTLPHESIMNAFAVNFTIVAWFVISVTSVLAALNTYEVSLSLLKRKGGN